MEEPLLEDYDGKGGFRALPFIIGKIPQFSLATLICNQSFVICVGVFVIVLKSLFCC